MGGATGKARPSKARKVAERGRARVTSETTAVVTRETVGPEMTDMFLPQGPESLDPFPVMPMLKSGKPLRDFSAYKRLRDSKTFTPALFTRNRLKVTEKTLKAEIKDVNETLQSAMEMVSTDDIAISKFKLHIVRKTNKTIDRDKLVSQLLEHISASEIAGILEACTVKSSSDFLTVTDMAKPKKVRGNGG